MTWGQTERRWKDQAHQTNGHPQHHLTVLNTVLHGWIDSQLKNTFLLGYSLIMTTIKWLVRGWTKKGRENKGRAWLSACQQQSRPYSSIDHKEKVCCVCECVSVLHLASTSCQLICLFAWRTRPRGRDELEGLTGPKSNEQNGQENYRTD